MLKRNLEKSLVNTNPTNGSLTNISWPGEVFRSSYSNIGWTTKNTVCSRGLMKLETKPLKTIMTKG